MYGVAGAAGTQHDNQNEQLRRRRRAELQFPPHPLILATSSNEAGKSTPGLQVNTASSITSWCGTAQVNGEDLQATQYVKFEDKSHIPQGNTTEKFDEQSVQSRKKKRFFVDSREFQNFILTLIFINATLMGVETYLNEGSVLLNRLIMLDKAFLVVFTIELALHFQARGFRMFHGRTWLIFDFVVVVASWGLTEKFSVIRAFRIFRAARIVTRVEGLRTLLLALLMVIPRLGVIGVLLLLVIYIFGVMFNNLFRFSYDMGITSFDYFSSLWKSLFTVFQLLTLDGWTDICREMMEIYKWVRITLELHISSFPCLCLNLINSNV